MTTTTVSADHVIDAAGDTGAGWLRIEAGIVRERGAGAPPPDARLVHLDVLGPGLVDTHVHGARGVDFAAPGTDPSPALDLHRATGATTLLASLATSTSEALLTRIAELRPLVREGALAGLHLEGPWLSPARRGAHRPDLLRAPDPREIDRVLAAGEGIVRMVTLAPELPGALDAVEHFVAAGVTVALGHSAADVDTARRAMDAGASVVTHLFNGMPPMLSREPGLAGAALSHPDVYVELIADGIHVSDTVIDVVFAAAAGRVSLVSDAVAAAGLGDGRYDLAGSEIMVADGVARLADGSSLAGSTMPLGTSVARLLARGLPAAPVVLAASLTPARAVGLDVAALRVGDAADLIAVSDGLVRTMKGGAWLTC